MGLTPEQRQVELRFDGTSIVITRKLSLAEFLEVGRHTGHEMLLLSCYSGDTLCARIAADETEKTVCIENLTTDYLKLPFGNNPNPSWADYQHFLEDRCIPKTRAGLQEYLEAIGVGSYEPLEIIRKTQGRIAEDDLWLTVEEVNGKSVRQSAGNPRFYPNAAPIFGRGCVFIMQGFSNTPPRSDTECHRLLGFPLDRGQIFP